MARKPIFDVIRTALGRGLQPGEVADIDLLLDRMGIARDGVTYSLSDPAAFFDALRGDVFSPLLASQVQGCEAILAECGKQGLGVAKTAYVLATARWESANSMQPVAEAYFLGEPKAEAFRRKLRYYPWYGRGLAQTTWDYNYQKVDDELGMGGALMKSPDLLLELRFAVPALVRAMIGGWYTGKSLATYLPNERNGTASEFVAARRIINGTDKAGEVAALAIKFQAALDRGGWA